MNLFVMESFHILLDGKSYSKLELFTVRFGFLAFFGVGFTKKMQEYSDPIAEKLELFSVKPLLDS